MSVFDADEPLASEPPDNPVHVNRRYSHRVRKLCLRQGLPVASYPFSGFWLDMGRPDDYGRAVEEFEARRDQFLPKEGR